MGCLFATALHRSGCATTLLLRASDTRETAQVVVERHGRSTAIELPAASGAAGGPISHLLVTTKAYDARHAVATVAHRLRHDSKVLLMMNGMGLADRTARGLSPTGHLQRHHHGGSLSPRPTARAARGPGPNAHRPTRNYRASCLVSTNGPAPLKTANGIATSRRPCG